MKNPAIPLSRRLFLGRLGATAAVTSLTAAPAVLAKDTPTEAPELIELGKRMNAAEARFLRADDEYRAARARAEAAMPAPPKSIVVPAANKSTCSNGRSEPLRQVDEMPTNWSEASVFVLQESYIWQTCDQLDALADGERPKDGRFHKALKRAQADHTAWMEAKDRVREETGFNAAVAERRQAMRDISVLAQAAFGVEARTPAGLLIQSRAFTTGVATEDGRHWVTALLGPKLALAAERILSQCALP